jgi:hypothetical protein
MMHQVAGGGSTSIDLSTHDHFARPACSMRASGQCTCSSWYGDAVFVRFLKRHGQETLRSFPSYDFLMLGYIRREQPVPAHLNARLPALIDVGAVESVGRGWGHAVSALSAFVRRAWPKGHSDTRPRSGCADKEGSLVGSSSRSGRRRRSDVGAAPGASVGFRCLDSPNA